MTDNRYVVVARFPAYIAAVPVGEVKLDKSFVQVSVCSATPPSQRLTIQV